jgi:outer membrane protein TolC
MKNNFFNKNIFIYLLTSLSLVGCTQNNQPPAWMENFSEIAIVAVQPSSKNAEEYGRYLYKPSLELDKTQNPEAKEISNFLNIKSHKAFKDFILSLRQMLKLRPELIEASSNIQEKAAKVFEVRGDFFPTVNMGVVQDNVISSDYSNLSTSRQTSGGYLDAYIDMDSTLIDFGGRNAAFNAALLEKEIAYMNFDLTINNEAFKYGKIYVEYASKIIEQYIYNAFEEDLFILQKEVKERFKGGVTTIFEVNSIEQSITRFNIRKALYTQELETKKSEYLSVFSSGDLNPLMIDAIDLLEIGKSRILQPDTIYKNTSGFLEEKIFEKRYKIAQQDYYVAQSSVSPNLKSKLRYKAFDIDSFNNDYELVMTFTGSLGVYDAGRSGSVASAALKRANTARARKNAVNINSSARLGTIESQINSINARLGKINTATKKYQKDLEIIKEKSKAISYSASEIISIKEKIFDQKLSFVDAYSSLNRLSLEVFHLHSIFPLLIGLGLDKEGVIE